MPDRLPKLFSRTHPGIVYETNIAMSPRSRLRAKFVICESHAAFIQMQRFGMGDFAVYDCAGITIRERDDPVFYSVALFNVKYLSLDILVHECVHVAHNYRERRRHGVFEKASPSKANGFHREESIAYPAGILAYMLISELQKRKLIRSDD